MKSRSSPFWITLSALVMNIVPAFPGEPQKCCVPIEMVVTRDLDPVSRTILTVTLKNASTETIRIGPAQNPWVGPSMLTIVGVRLPSGTTIANRTQAIVEPSPMAEMLSPGATVSDRIDLREMYPEIAKDILDGRNELILFWTYKLKTRSEGESEQLAGWLLVKASK